MLGNIDERNKKDGLAGSLREAYDNPSNKSDLNSMILFINLHSRIGFEARVAPPLKLLFFSSTGGGKAPLLPFFSSLS